ncbi:hypothetical protein NC651_021179 [Populus alba x Populus x berolinensis]|nr:hypothetical protein NC651_021179 [Populus alba x Populus x berolinensis]
MSAWQYGPEKEIGPTRNAYSAGTIIVDAATLQAAAHAAWNACVAPIAARTVECGANNSRDMVGGDGWGFKEEEMLVEELLVLVPFLLVQEEVMLELYVEELLVLVLQYGVGDGCCHGFSLSSWLEKRGLTSSASNACLS